MPRRATPGAVTTPVESRYRFASETRRKHVHAPTLMRCGVQEPAIHQLDDEPARQFWKSACCRRSSAIIEMRTALWRVADNHADGAGNHANVAGHPPCIVQ